MAGALPANGLWPGSLVEIFGLDSGDELNEQLGQALGYTDGKYEIQTIQGATVKVDAKNVRTPEDLKKSGVDGADEDFDLLIGPLTIQENIAEEVSMCLFEKGFCVVKVCQKADAVGAAVDRIRELGDEGRLGRLPQEVEEGYLGGGSKGKVIWLDPDDPDRVKDELLEANDRQLSQLAALLQPLSEDTIGRVIDERTPALVSLSLLEDEEDDYPYPMADDKTLGDYLGTWRRGLVRAVHFMGPGTADVTLEVKDGPAASALPNQMDAVGISASPNTIIMFRTECFSYSCMAPDADEVCTIMTSFLSQAPTFTLASWEGDERLLTMLSKGPPPTQGESVNVMNMANRLGASWDGTEAVHAGLASACDTIFEIPYNRFDVDWYFCDEPDTVELGPPRTIQRHTSYVDGVEMFDNKYFEIMAAEAGAMDPLQRQVLEVGGTNLYKHGITKKHANRNSHHGGCSVGLDKADFPTLGLSIGPSAGNNALAIVANRFSFSFNMKGPNYICDTACSASLTATHLAKLMLLERVYDPLEFHVAIGTHLCLSPGPWIGCSMSHMVSPEGRCFTFNATANGYLRGEGTSGMLLKFGQEELKNRDCIYRASQSGQDGRSASLTAPNGPAQEEIIGRAIKEAKMTPPESTVWECHGTGTSLGDPIEVGAVRKVQIRMDRPEPLMITSSKTNIGHLEGGAAMAAMCKCVIQCMYACSYTALHLRELNPHLEHSIFDAFFQAEVNHFPEMQGISHVSSFGFGGTNGHVIFWGQHVGKAGLSVPHLIMDKIRKMAPAEVRPVGDDPSEWESDMFEADFKPGDRYTITMNETDPEDASIKWVKQDCVQEEEDEQEDEEAVYCITGNFNSWEDDRMMPGDIAGQHAVNVIVPEDGILEFRFLKDGDAEKVIAPDRPNCIKKTALIQGPAPDLTNTWTVRLPADTEVQVELMVVKNKFSVLWFKSE